MENRLQVVEFDGAGIRKKWSEKRGCWGYVGVDALAAMGSKDPDGSLNQMVKSDALDELRPHTWTDMVSGQVQRRKARLFDKQGLALLAMKAQTEKAATFRAWVAALVEAIDEGKVSFAPGPNADTGAVVQRVEARLEASETTKGAHKAISDAGGKPYHHINWERKLSQTFHGVTPKVFKRTNGIGNNRSTADFEPATHLASRITANCVLVERQHQGLVRQDNLSEEIRTVPEQIADFMRKMIGRPLLEARALPDIRPQVEAVKRERKRLSTGPQQALLPGV